MNIELKAGDVSVHNPTIIHGSSPNTSDKWRVGLTLRYIPTTTLVKREGHENILFRGDAKVGVDNLYAPKAKYLAGEHMSFKGAESWA